MNLCVSNAAPRGRATGRIRTQRLGDSHPATRMLSVLVQLFYIYVYVCVLRVFIVFVPAAVVVMPLAVRGMWVLCLLRFVHRNNSDYGQLPQ